MDIQLFLMNLKRLESETAKLYDELAELSRRRFPELCLFLLDLADEERGHESYVDSLRRLLGSLEITERTDEEQEDRVVGDAVTPTCRSLVAGTEQVEVDTEFAMVSPCSLFLTD